MQKKKKKIRINYKKLFSYIFIFLICLYLLICSICYSAKVMQHIKKIDIPEKTIIVK